MLCGLDIATSDKWPEPHARGDTPGKTSLLLGMKTPKAKGTLKTKTQRSITVQETWQLMALE